jgi:hypothetical protein
MFVFDSIKVFALTEGTAEDQESIKSCLLRFGDHPFKVNKNGLYTFNIIDSVVRVIGIGSKEIVDNIKTDNPVLC